MSTPPSQPADESSACACLVSELSSIQGVTRGSRYPSLLHLLQERLTDSLSRQDAAMIANRRPSEKILIALTSLRDREERRLVEEHLPDEALRSYRELVSCIENSLNSAAARGAANVNATSNRLFHIASGLL